jgi:glycosyltransferase involved in cell wall biosynthesis
VIVTEHGVALRELMLYFNDIVGDMPSGIFWNNVATNVVKAVYSTADVIAPVCGANAAWELNLGVNPSKVKVIYNGVDTGRFKPRKIQGSQDSSKKTVVYVGRIDAWKDVVNLLYAIRYVNEKVPAQLLIYGGSNDLEYSKKCVETVEKLGLQDTVKFMGQTKEPEKAYNDADVVVTSSVAEGFPLWVIEAMSCGRAVVSTDVGGVKEVLEGCGLLVNTVAPRQLADSIVTILQDSELKRNFEEAAVKRVNQGFTLAQSIDQYRKLYEDLIAAYGAGSGRIAKAVAA